ncbi:hypothetical protein CMI37_23375 [Candidatus Pacearchaeota archaeon]|nr:hypothetical protein [Candidatus Pacearchaeota archaeon]
MAYDRDILVRYGNFTFPAPTPFVSRSYKNQYVGGTIWSTTVEVTLAGQIAILPKRDGSTGGNSYLELKSKRNAIAKAFAGALGKNFQQLSVSGHGTSFVLDNCSVEGLSFGSSDYNGLVDYTINIKGYDHTNPETKTNFIIDNYGVVSPTDSWAYSDAGGTATLTHTVSAQGYNTSSGSYNAFLKAKAFVESRKGTSYKIPSFLIENAHPGSALILTSKSEQVNRLGGSYSITENYSFATNESKEPAGKETGLPSMQTANILLTYSLTADEQQGGDFSTVTLSGNVVGNKASNTSWTDVKKDFRKRDFYDLANKAYLNYTLPTRGANKNLNKSPINFSINPNEEARTISFSLTYDNNDLYEKAAIKNSGGAYFDYNISFQHDNITDIISVNCNGSIRVRGALGKRNRVAKELLDTEVLKDNSFRVRQEAEKLYHKMYPSRTNYKLSPRPSNLSVGQNEFNGTITYSATFSDNDFPKDSELQKLDYSVQVTPASQEYRPVPSCNENGHYLIFDLNLKSKREKTSISLNANTDSRNAKALEGAWGEAQKTSNLLLGSLLLESDENGDLIDNVLRLDSENKVENKNTGAITYSRAFSKEKDVEDITLLKI